MNSVQPAHNMVVRGQPEVPPSVDEVAAAYTEGRNWHCQLRDLAAPHDLKAVKALQDVLDLASANTWTDLQEAAEDHLKKIPCTTEAWSFARLVLEPRVDDIIFALEKAEPGQANPMWKRAIEKWAEKGDRHALDGLSMLLDSPRGSLTTAARSALLKMQDTTADASMHAEINRVLETSVPYREAGLRTQADGDCLIHAWMGTSNGGSYQGDLGIVQNVRGQLRDALKEHGPAHLPGPVLQIVRGFYMELQEASLDVEGSDQPNRQVLKALAEQLKLNGARTQIPFEQLADGDKANVWKVCADFFALQGRYLPCASVPLLAWATKQAVSLYVDTRGWQHFGNDGQPCEPSQNAVAIRFHPGRQHYERVERPRGDGVPDEPRARHVPHALEAHRFRRLAVPQALPDARTPAIAIREKSAVSQGAVTPVAQRSGGLVARFFNWVSGFLR